MKVPTLLALLIGTVEPIFRRLRLATQRDLRTQRPAVTADGRAELHKAMGISLVALVLGLVFTAAGVLWQREQLNDRAAVQFNQIAERIDRDIQRRLTLPQYGLKGLRGTYAAMGEVRSATFRAYVESRDLPREFPGIRGIGFIERVPRAELQNFIAKVRADDAPDFQISTSGNLDDLLVIKYIEPMRANAPAWGYDVGQELRRREAAERAMQTGESTLTAKITLLQDSKKTPGFLLYVPIYRSGTRPVTPDQRREAILGLVYAPIIASEIFEGLTGNGDADASVEIYEGTRRNDEGLIYRDISLGPTVPNGLLAQHLNTHTVSVAGSTLTVQVRSTLAFERRQDRSTLVVAGALGVGISFAIAFVLWLMASARVRAQQLAQSMTADLDRMARVVRHTNNAVMVQDAQSRITWVNAGFTRLTGYTMDDAIGKTPGELLSSGKADTQTLETLSMSAAAGIACRVEILNRAKDGREYWADTEVQPIHDDANRLVGFIEIGTDVSARVRDTQKIAELSDRMTLAIEGGSDGLWDWIDISQDAQWWSPNYHEMLGYSPEELSPSASSHRAIMHPGSVEGSRSMFQASLAGGPTYDMELQLQTKSSGYRWFRLRAKVYFDDAGKAIRMAGSTQDIHERKLAQAAVAKTNERFALAADAAGIGVWEWDLATQNLTWDAKMYKLFGQSEEAKGRPSEILMSSLHPVDKVRFEADLQETIRNHKPFEASYRIYWPNGEQRHIRAAARAVRDITGRTLKLIGVNFDVTDVKLAQEALSKNEVFLDRVGRIAGVGGWRVDLKEKTVEWSAETRRIHEAEQDFVPKLEEGIQFYAADARPVIAAAVARSMQTGEGWDLELPLVTSKGRAIWVRTVGEAEFENGVPVMLVGAFQDITERRQRDQDLYLLETSIGRIKDLVMITEAQTLKEPGPRIVYLNEAFETITGYTRAEAIGRSPRMLQGPDTDRAALARIAQALETGMPITEELLNYTKTGVPYWIEIAISPLRSETGEVTHFVAVERDTTERHTLHEAINKSNQLMKDILQNLPCGLSVFDGNLVLVAQNPQLRSLLGLPDSLFGGTETNFEEIIRFNALAGEYGVGDVEAIVSSIVERARHPTAHIFERQRPNGVPLEIRGVPLPGGGFITTYVDISESKKGQLLLSEALEAAKQASVFKSQFLANMSHEIRTPMNAILGLLQLLQNTELDLRQQDYVGKTEGAARSLLGLLNHILDISKVEAGKMALDPRPFRIDRMLRDLSVILSANVGPKDIDVLFDVDPLLPPALVGDDMRLLQILINLGGNAIKFTAQGEVVLRLRQIDHVDNKVTVEFAVTDSGIGIAPENQALIFSGFSQAEASTTRRFGGTGLGLAISSRLTRLMGGDLQLESALGTGSTFCFRVQFEVASQDSIPSAAAPAATSGLEKLRVLVVDDNPVARRLMVDMAHSLGWRADAAAGGTEALELIQHPLNRGQAYQAIFMDWRMPDMDGWQTCQRIREMAVEPPVVMMMVTAHGREMLAQRSAQDQSLLNGFLVKPVTAAMLLESLRDAQAVGAAAATNIPLPTAQPVAKPKRLLGMRLLVVEDNKINQMVAKGLLVQEGADVSLADDGQQGVAAVQATPSLFDAVLMDVQMPVMDGYTATRAIRQDLGHTTLPIIAMTANAMASDREACLAAGMDDHIGKPFNLDELVTMLLRVAAPSDPR